MAKQSSSLDEKNLVDDSGALEKATVDPYESVSQAERQRIVRKLDWHLLPFVSLLYLLSFLDRSNIGNAKLAGMATNLGLVGLKYNIAAAVFFIPYALAEVPSNIALKLYRPSRWIPSIMILWGTVMTLMSLVNTFKGLIIARFFLGLTEAGLFPGVTFYISLWYKREQQALRVAIFFSAATVAGAFGGILAYGIERMEGIGGLHGWQWIFLLEGLTTVIIAFSSYFTLHDYPETATFLTEAERAFVIEDIRRDSYLASNYERRFVIQALKDYKTYIQVAIYMGTLIPVYVVSLFLPTIVKELGFSNANAQLLTIPPFAVGCAFTIGVGILSDKYKMRGPIIICCALVGLVGYIVLYFEQTRASGGYVGTFLVTIGAFPNVAVMLAWAGGNAGGAVKRGVALALVIGLGNLGGICSSFIYYDPPHFHHGHGTSMGCLAMSIVLTTFAMWNYKRLNKEKDALCARENITEKDHQRYVYMGDDSPLFRYTI